jgi:transcriptional regulator with XRE-family HTH domain
MYTDISVIGSIYLNISSVKSKILKLQYFVEMSDFRKNLREELDYQGLTVKELSAKTRIAKRTLDCYLRSRASMPPADAALRIAEALGVSVEYLLTGHDSRAKPLSPANPSIRLVLQILEELDDSGRETLLGLAQVLKKQHEARRAENKHKGAREAPF